MTDRYGCRRLPLHLRAYIHLRMFRNAFRVTRRGLRHFVGPGDTINLKIDFLIQVEADTKVTTHV